MTAEDRARWAQWMNDEPAYLAVTLRYASGPVTRDRMQRDIEDLHARVDRALLGRRFNLMPEERRSAYWAIPEQIDGNPHMHVGWHFPGDAARKHQHANCLIKLIDQGIWQRVYAPGGTYDVQPYDADRYHHGNGWAGYATKALQLCEYIMLSEHGMFDYLR